MGAGQCVHFTALAEGDFYVTLAQSPKHRDKWYYVKIGDEEVAIYKVESLIL